MPKFFEASDSEPESEEETTEESESEEEQPTVSKFMKGGEESDSEEDSVRVVKSARDKRYEELHSTVEQIYSHMKKGENVGDWNAIQTDFDKLNKLIEKSRNIFEKEGVPKFYIKLLAQLEDFHKTISEEKPKMKKENTKSFNTMKQKLKKHNRNYEQQIEEYKKNPEAFEEEEEEEEEEFESDEEREVKAKKPAKEKVEEEKEKKPMGPEDIRKSLTEILRERGRKGAEPKKLVEKIEALEDEAKTADLKLELLVNKISVQFDIVLPKKENIPAHISATTWKEIAENLHKVLDILKENPSIRLIDVTDVPAARGAVEESIEEEKEVAEEKKQKTIQTSLLGFVERLDDEFYKSFLRMDLQSTEYSERLSDTSLFLNLATRLQDFYEKQGKVHHCAILASRKLEHIYYKTPEDENENNDIQKQIVQLSELIYSYGDNRIKMRALLCEVFFNATRDNFYEARDMMLMSHLQDTIQNFDPASQILFNRTMVQLGLCAFRIGLTKEAHNCLTEMYITGKIKELLGQGITSTRFSDKADQVITADKQVPQHLHINLELLEGVHLVTALLLEVPNMAANAFDVKKKVINKIFRKYLDNYERQISGPPENTRDMVAAASKALGKGNWKQCEEYLMGLPLWNHIKNNEKIKEMLKRKIKEEGLRTFLFTNSIHYDSLSLDQLSIMFQLEKNTVHAIVSKMMHSEELHASWDQPTGCIVMHKVEPTRLQYLALSFAEKTSQYIELTERSETKAGSRTDSKQRDWGRRQGYRQGRQKQGEQRQYKPRDKQNVRNRRTNPNQSFPFV